MAPPAAAATADLLEPVAVAAPLPAVAAAVLARPSTAAATFPAPALPSSVTLCRVVACDRFSFPPRRHSGVIAALRLRCGVSGCHNTPWRWVILPVFSFRTLTVPLGSLCVIPSMMNVLSAGSRVGMRIYPTVPNDCRWPSGESVPYHTL